MLLVDLLEVVHVHQHQRQPVAGALAAHDLAPQRLVHGGVVQAPGQPVGAGGQHQAGVGAGVAAGGGRQLAEGLQQLELVVGHHVLAAVGHRQHAAQLAVPVHRHGQRAPGLAEQREVARVGHALVVVGQQRPVLLGHLAGQPVAGGHAVADHLGREAEGGLHDHPLLRVAAVDGGVVGVQDAGRLVADPHQHPVQVQAVVQRLGRTRQRGLLGDLHGALARHAQLGQRGRGGGGERLGHLDLLVGEGAPLGVGQDQDVPAAGLDLHRQRQEAAGGVHRPQRRVQRQRGVTGGEGHGVVLGRVAQHGELVDPDRPAGDAGGRAGGQDAQALLALGAQQHHPADAEELARLVDQALAHGVGGLQVALGRQQPRDREHGVAGTAQAA